MTILMCVVFYLSAKWPSTSLLLDVELRLWRSNQFNFSQFKYTCDKIQWFVLHRSILNEFSMSLKHYSVSVGKRTSSFHPRMFFPRHSMCLNRCFLEEKEGGKGTFKTDVCGKGVCKRVSQKLKSISSILFIFVNLF